MNVPRVSEHNAMAAIIRDKHRRNCPFAGLRIVLSAMQIRVPLAKPIVMATVESGKDE